MEIVRLDFVFSYWIFAWYLLYISKITTFNPKFVLLIGLIGNSLHLFLMIYFNNSLFKIIIFIIINIFIKIIPFYTLLNTKYKIKDVIFSFFLFIIYVFWLKINNKLNINFYKYLNEVYKSITENKSVLPLTNYLEKILNKSYNVKT
jgi:hypothetical protein